MQCSLLARCHFSLFLPQSIIEFLPPTESLAAPFLLLPHKQTTNMHLLFLPFSSHGRRLFTHAFSSLHQSWIKKSREPAAGGRTHHDMSLLVFLLSRRHQCGQCTAACRANPPTGGTPLRHASRQCAGPLYNVLLYTPKTISLVHLAPALFPSPFLGQPYHIDVLSHS